MRTALLAVLLIALIIPSGAAAFPWCGIQELFFWNESSDVDGYRVLDHIPELTDQVEVNVTVSSSTGSSSSRRMAVASGVARRFNHRTGLLAIQNLPQRVVTGWHNYHRVLHHEPFC